ncbi:MAG: hypothetical protein EXS05_14820 [Planctomycetaceae bacterium]|nr:hypothetical protein [Planctomycetaceae bacterium]
MSEMPEPACLEGQDPVNGPLSTRPEFSDDKAAESTRERIRQLPPEVGVVLVGVGVLGIVLPGPMGTPLVLAGGLVLMPRAFNGVERWFARKFPGMHRVGMKYVDRFMDDFERRYPPNIR